MPAFTVPRIPPSAPYAGIDPTGHVAAHALGLHHYRPEASTVVICVHGDIDASNASDLIAFARHAIGSYRGLVLDLREVTFFGTEGVSALRIIDEARTPSSRFAVVPSRPVVRVLKLGATAPAMPIADDLDTALVAVQSDGPVLQLVTGARL